MNILTEIVNNLTENNESLTTAFLKLKVLAQRLDNTKMLKWVNLELNGYGADIDLPDYRIKGCRFVGNYRRFNVQVSNYQLPLKGLPSEIRETLENIKFYGSISGLESMKSESNEKILSEELNRELVDILSYQYQDETGNSISLLSASKQINISVVYDILTQVRSIALDMVLELEKNLGYEIDMEQIMIKKEDANEVIRNVMNQTNIINYGSGDIVNSGEKNAIENVQNATVVTGDNSTITSNDNNQEVIQLINNLKEEIAKSDLSDQEKEDNKEILELLAEKAQEDSPNKTQLNHLMENISSLAKAVGVGTTIYRYADQIINTVQSMFF